jgi:hypothetical protein
MMRTTMTAAFFAATLLAATLPGSSAFAETVSHPYCLLTGPDQECAFDSMAQCQASKHGNVDFCEPNSLYGQNSRYAPYGAYPRRYQ